MTTNKFARLGSVSSATMRAEDLVPEFLYTLGQLDKKRHDEFVSANADVLDNDEADEESDGYEDGLQEVCDELFTILNDYAPPYAYFGAHEGDGCEYGFWVSWDSLNDDCRYGTVCKVDAGDEWPEDAKEAEYVLEVNDHGNATLYTTDGKEVWSVV